MVTIPVVFQQSGWLIPTFLMLLFMYISSLASTALCETMACIPGNDRFQGRIELCTLAKKLFPRWAFWLTFVLFVVALQAINIASIIESAQTMDYALLEVFNYTGALEAYPHPGWAHVSGTPTSDSPFPNGSYVLSIGFVIVLIATIPMGYFNLDDNIYVQVGAFLFLIVIMLEWLVNFGIIFHRDGVHFERVPVYGKNQTQVLGNIIFNYAFVVSVPSWANEKEEKVSVNKSVWWSNVVSTIMFLILGFMGGWAFTYSGNDDILSVTNAAFPHGALHIIAKICVYFFPIVVLLSGIPVFSIIVRYNLIENNVCGKAWANFWGVIFPWLVSIPFCTGNGLGDVLNWTSLIVNGWINFVIPFILYMIARKMVRQAEQDGSLGDEIDRPLFVAVPHWKLGSRDLGSWMAIVNSYITWLLVMTTIIISIVVVAVPAYKNPS